MCGLIDAESRLIVRKTQTTCSVCRMLLMLGKDLCKGDEMAPYSAEKGSGPSR